MRGLGTNPETGLVTPSSAPPTAQPDPSTEKVPDVVLTTPDGDVGAAPTPAVPTETVVANFEDRHRVFGSNTLPTRPSKTLLQLMWMALKDKVLVSEFRRLFAFQGLISLGRSSCASLLLFR